MLGSVVRTGDLSVRLGDQAVLESVSFVAEDGVTALLGPNGAGKSTLLKAILGVHAPCQGELEVLGQVHGSLNESRSIWSEVGYLPQDFGGPARQRVDDFLAYSYWLRGRPMSDTPAEVDQALSICDLTARRRSRIGELSGGMLRRLGVAAAAIGSPSLVLLDEPSTGLDLLYREELVRVIDRLLERCRAVILTTHLPEDIKEICDRSVFMSRGRVVGTWSAGATDLVDAYRSCLTEERV